MLLYYIKEQSSQLFINKRNFSTFLDFQTNFGTIVSIVED